MPLGTVFYLYYIFGENDYIYFEQLGEKVPEGFHIDMKTHANWMSSI